MMQTLARLRSDRRGAVVVESVVALIPMLIFFVGLLQVADGYAAQLLMRRAASAATRAAVVVLPDDAIHYSGSGRQSDIESAAKTVLGGNPNFSAISVKVSGGQSGSAPTTVKVSATYRCLFRAFPIFCGKAKTLPLSASATLPYQGASYRYGP